MWFISTYLLADEVLHDCISLVRLHALIVISGVVVTPVLGPVLLHNALHRDQLRWCLLLWLAQHSLLQSLSHIAYEAAGAVAHGVVLEC